MSDGFGGGPVSFVFTFTVGDFPRGGFRPLSAPLPSREWGRGRGHLTMSVLIPIKVTSYCSRVTRSNERGEEVTEIGTTSVRV